MPPMGFEPTIPASERPQTYALDRAATGTGICTPLSPRNALEFVTDSLFTKQNRSSILFQFTFHMASFISV